MLSQVLLPIAATLLGYALYHALQILYYDLTSPLRHVAGPKNPSLIFGNFRDMTSNFNLASQWRKEYGPTFRFRGLFSISELHTTDLKALNHIVSNATIYQKSEAMRSNSVRLMGKGILALESDEHRRQRRILNPAFGVPQIRAMTEIFVDKSVQLRDIWAKRVEQAGGEASLEVLSWLRRMTLDVIGEAGFDYQFNALASDGKPNPLNDAFTELFHSPQANQYAMLRLCQGIIPILRILPLPGWRVLQNARDKMYNVGLDIITRNKAGLKQAPDGEKELGNRRDLLSILLKANTSSSLTPSQRLTDTEVVAQIPAFQVAGHETSSVATAWALYALSIQPDVQTKLREELFTIDTDNPTMDQLNSLPYLEKVIRETMRLYSPVVFTNRMAMTDDVLPLSKPYIDKNGKEHHSLPIRKGQTMHIPVWAVNTDPETWGPDALAFRPDRWDNIPEAAGAIPGVWANLISFFAGPHNCIGFRFSLVEQKALLFTLIRAFEVVPAVPGDGIQRIMAGLLQRPAVVTAGNKGTGLPLILKAVNRPFWGMNVSLKLIGYRDN